MEIQDTGRALDWNEAVEEKAYEPLKAGIYRFQVTGFMRKRHEGSENLSPCPMAELNVEIDGGAEGKRTIKHNLFLHTKTQNFLAQFFMSIGMPKGSDDKVIMDWSKVPGSKGSCELYVDEFTTRSGNVVKTNKIKKFISPTAPATNSSWQAGSF